MHMRKFFGIGLLLTLLALGIWLLGRPNRLTPESPLRQSALAPGGFFEETAGQPIDLIYDPIPGSPIDLSQPLPEPAGGDSQYELWLNGDIDIENEGLVSEAERVRLQEAAASLPASSNIQIADSGPEPYSLVPEFGFDSIDITDCCVSGANVPPDPELAVGRNHVIAAVNVSFEIYSKSGAVLVSDTTFAAFFSGVAGCTTGTQLFDPNVLYDEQADRFILGIDAGGTGYCLAASATGNPAGVWNRYRISTGPEFFDYPHAGVGHEAIYMGGNMFIGNPFAYSRIWAFRKSDLYAGAALTVRSKTLASAEDTPQPANLHGFYQGTWPTGGPHYFITETNFNGATYSVFAWNAPFGANTLAKTGTFNMVAATGVPAGFPINAPQAGSGAKLMANDWRPQDAEFRNGSLWTTNTIACNPGGGTVDCVRWAEVNPANGTAIQAGVYASSSQYRIFGDAAVNHCEDMGIGYTKTSGGLFPGIWVAGRNGGDPPGILQTETQLKAGELAYTAFDGSPHRWGDYTGFTSDPNGRDIWYLGEYSKNTGSAAGRWGTYIGCYALPSCSAPSAFTQEDSEIGAGVPAGSDYAYLPYAVYQEVLPCGYPVGP